MCCKKRTKPKKNDNKDPDVLIVGNVLDHPSGAFRFYNSNTDSLVIINSVT